MTVDPATARHKADHAGATYSFCRGGCREKFVDADPARYLSPPAAKPAVRRRRHLHLPDASARSARSGPGACPICGMALEPVTVTADGGPNPELADMTRRFWIGLALAVAGGRAGDGRASARPCHAVGARSSNWIQFALATPVVLWAGWPFFERGWASLVTRSLNMFTLIALGIGVAWVYSVVAMLAPSLFPPPSAMPTAPSPVYFEAAAVITVLVLLGQVLELRAREQTSGAIRALLDLAPKTARRLARRRHRRGRAARADRSRRPAARAARREGPGRRRGARGPARRRRIDGHRRVHAGDKEAGAQGRSAARSTRPARFVMRAEKVGADTLLARIVQMVAEAQRSRAPIQRLADQVSGWFVPAVIAVALRRLRRLGAGRARAAPRLRAWSPPCRC